MKNTFVKLICFMAVISIVVSSLYACKGKGEGDVSTEPIDTSTIEVMAPTAAETDTTVKELEMYEIDEIIQDAIGYDIVWDGDYTMLTAKQKMAIQQKMYEKGYVAEFSENGLSVKPVTEFESSRKVEETEEEMSFIIAPTDAATTATTTKKATTTKASGVTVATTKAGQTTTARHGIVAGTTASNLGTNSTTKKVTTTSAKNNGTTSASGGGTVTTTVPSTSSGDSGSGTGTAADTIKKPEKTYYDKYVTDVLKSGTYTLAGVMAEDGNKIAFTRYVTANKSSVVAKVTSSSIEVTMKIIDDNGKVTILIPALKRYFKASASEFSDYADMDDINDLTGIINSEDLQYAGVTILSGGNIETYKSKDGSIIRFQFDSNGLKKVSVKTADGVSEEYNITLVAGVTSSEAFTIPSTYTEISEAELEKYLGGLDA